ncbi:MAG TPA: hypothetical protein VG253_07255 [Streptosporangiaceae bacterium]|jgi:hypothetical protein|nr:hypothetical protein [Streptosporangiaceae bacterium]
MGLAAIARSLPLRITAGAFILNSGLSKWNADKETAAMLHGTAVTAYPFLAKMKPEDFTKLLSVSEVAVGAVLLVPVVPTAIAGVALTGFSSALLGLYLTIPGMRQEGSLRPTQQGIALAKDSWLLGMGLGLTMDAITSGASKSSED